MVKCPLCGLENADNAKFCAECGQKLSNGVYLNTDQFSEPWSYVPPSPTGQPAPGQPAPLDRAQTAGSESRASEPLEGAPLEAEPYVAPQPPTFEAREPEPIPAAPVTAPTVTQNPEPPAAPKQKNRLPVILGIVAGVLVLAVAVGLGVFFTLRGREVREPNKVTSAVSQNAASTNTQGTTGGVSGQAASTSTAFSTAAAMTTKQPATAVRSPETKTAPATAPAGAPSVSVPTNQSGTLTVVTNATFPPFEYKENGRYIGIDIEIAERIAAKLGLTLKIEDVDFDSIVVGVAVGKYDIGIAGMTVTEERKKNVNFSIPYCTHTQRILVRGNSPITSPRDLSDGNWMVGVRSGSTGEIYGADEFGDARIAAYATNADAVRALSSGKVDAVILDGDAAETLAEETGLVLLSEPYTEENYAICVDPSNAALLDAVNGALRELISDGSIQAIIDKYS